MLGISVSSDGFLDAVISLRREGVGWPFATRHPEDGLPTAAERRRVIRRLLESPKVFYFGREFRRRRRSAGRRRAAPSPVRKMARWLLSAHRPRRRLWATARHGRPRASVPASGLGGRRVPRAFRRYAAGRSGLWAATRIGPSPSAVVFAWPFRGRRAGHVFGPCAARRPRSRSSWLRSPRRWSSAGFEQARNRTVAPARPKAPQSVSGSAEDAGRKARSWSAPRR